LHVIASPPSVTMPPNATCELKRVAKRLTTTKPPLLI